MHTGYGKYSDLGATLPYIVRRCEGDDTRLFISVFEAHEGAERFVRDVAVLDRAGTLAVKTAQGTDYIMSHETTGTLTAAVTRLTGHFAVASVQDGRVALTWVEPEGR